MRACSTLASLAVGLVGAALLAAPLGACGSRDESTLGGGGGEGEAGTDAAPPFERDASRDAHPCVGLECRKPACDNGATTTLTGKVFDPSGTVPLYNAL